MQMSLSRTVKRVNNPGVIIEVMSLGLSQQGHIYVCPRFLNCRYQKGPPLQIALSLNGSLLGIHAGLAF